MKPGRTYTVEKFSAHGTPYWGKSITETYRQKKPYKSPLPFTSYGGEWLSGGSNEPGWMDYPQSWYSSGASPWIPTRQSAYNKAYEKLVGQLGERAGYAENIAQWRQARQMVSGDASTAKAVRLALRQRRQTDIAIERSILRLLPHAKRLRDLYRYAQWRRWRKTLSDVWLEVHFGWQPLVQDVFTTVKLLEEPFPRTQIKGRSSDSWTEGNLGPKDKNWSVTTNQLKIYLRAWSQCSNPDTALLNSMGLVNPATLAWQLIPFSFVVDWFVNVEQVLNASTDFVGIGLSGASTTNYHTHRSQSHFVTNWGRAQSDNFYKGYCVSRGLGDLSPPRLALRAFNGFSPTRGITAIALLNKFLKTI